MELFLVFSLYGIIAGGTYLLFCFIRRIFNYNLILGVPIDIITGLAIGFLFFYPTLQYALGEFRLYLVLGFLLGFLACTITFKNFVATVSDFVYNRIKRLINFIKSKTIRRRTNEGGQTNKTR